MVECLVCYTEVPADKAVVLGACAHVLCLDCAKLSVVSSMEALAVAGGAHLPSTATAHAAARSETTPVPGLLCCFCVGSDEAKAAYARQFEAAVKKRDLRSAELIAITSSACPDVETWLAATARHGLPPGWISPEAFEKIRAAAAASGAPILPVHVAAYERSVVPAVLLISSLVRAADRARLAVAEPAEGGDGARADAAPAAPSLQRAPSAVRPVACPNSSCKQILAIDAVVAKPRHLSCPSCVTGFCGACGQRWTAEADGTSHLGATCAEHYDVLNAAEAARRRAELLLADSSVGEGPKLCPNPTCGALVIRHRGHACHSVTCGKCSTGFCYCCLMTDREKSTQPHHCPSWCDPDSGEPTAACDCVPCPTCASGPDGRRACRGDNYCGGSDKSCTSCGLGNRPETDAEREARLKRQAEAIAIRKARYPAWTGPRRARTDAVLLGDGGRGGGARRVPRGLENVWRGAGGLGRLAGVAARVREALQLLHAAVYSEPATRPLQPRAEEIASEAAAGGAAAAAAVPATAADGAAAASAAATSVAHKHTDPHEWWLQRLPSDDACAIDESLAMLAECALRENGAATAAGAAGPAGPAGAGGAAAALTAFADGFSLPFAQWETRAAGFSDSARPCDLTFAGALLGHISRPGAARDRLSALGPLLRLLRAYAAAAASASASASGGAGVGAGAGVAPAAPSSSSSSSSALRGPSASAYACQALMALAALMGANVAASAPDAPAVGGAGAAGPARPQAAGAAATPEAESRRAGWALELASVEAFEAMMAVLEAAAAGALPADAVASVHALACRLAGDPQMVAAVRGAADNIRADTSRLLESAVQRAREAGSSLVPRSMRIAARGAVDEGTWDAAISVPPEPAWQTNQRCQHGDLITFEHRGSWVVAVPLILTPEGRARMAWLLPRSLTGGRSMPFVPANDYHIISRGVLPPPNPYGRSFDPRDEDPFLLEGDLVTPRSEDEVRRRIIAGLQLAVDNVDGAHPREYGADAIEATLRMLQEPDASGRPGGDWVHMSFVDKLADRQGEPFSVEERFTLHPSRPLVRMRAGEDQGRQAVRHFGCFLRMCPAAPAAGAAAATATATPGSEPAGASATTATGTAAESAPSESESSAAPPKPPAEPRVYSPGSVVVSADGKAAALVLVPPKHPSLAGTRSFEHGVTCYWDAATGAPRRGGFLLADEEVSAVHATPLCKGMVDGAPAASRLPAGSRVRLLMPAEIIALAASAPGLSPEVKAAALTCPAERPAIAPLHPYDPSAEGRRLVAARLAAVDDWVVHGHGWAEGTDAPAGRGPAAASAPAAPAEAGAAAAAAGGAGAAPAAAPEPPSAPAPAAGPLVTHIYSPSTGAAATTLSLWLEPVEGAPISAALPEDALFERLNALCTAGSAASVGGSAPAMQPQAAARALLAWYAAVAAPQAHLRANRKLVADALGVTASLARGPIEVPAAAGAAAASPLAGVRLAVPMPAVPADRPGSVGFSRIFEPQAADAAAPGGGRPGRDDDRRRTNGGFATEEEAIAEAIRRSLEALDGDDGWEPMPPAEPEAPPAAPEPPLDEETRRILPALLCTLSRLHYECA